MRQKPGPQDRAATQVVKVIPDVHASNHSLGEEDPQASKGRGSRFVRRRPAAQIRATLGSAIGARNTVAIAFRIMPTVAKAPAA